MEIVPLSYPAGTRFYFPKRDLGVVLSTARRLAHDHELCNRSVHGIRQGEDPWAKEMASSLPGSSCKVVWCVHAPQRSLLWPFLSAFPAHVAEPLHMLLGNAPTLVALVHPEEGGPSSCVSPEGSRALW